MKLPNLNQEQTDKLVPRGTILCAYRGSRAHNTWISPTDPNSTDDIDILSVFIEPLREYLKASTLDVKNRGTRECMLPAEGLVYDAVSYELRKFVHLCLKGNPNVLSHLWMEDNYYLSSTYAGHLLRASKDLFISKQVYHSYVGYARGQFHRMTHGAKNGIMGAKRKALVDLYGYDCKNASHLIRLLHQGIEFLGDGVLRVAREDRAELIEIKTGKWSLERVQKTAQDLFRLAEEAYVRSDLPPKPLVEKADELVYVILLNEGKVIS